MRIRTTKPEFWRSKTIAALPWDVRFVLKGLESYVDDNGVGKDDIALIAADVFPRDLSGNPRETLARLSEAISQLSEAGLIVRYEFDGEDLIYIERWKDIQRIDKPGRGRFPRPDGTMEYADDVIREHYRNPRETLARVPEVVAPVAVEQGNRGTGEKEAKTSSSCPGSEIPDDRRERPDVDQLCERLRDRVIANGAKATITRQWRTEARLLLDRDGRDHTQALRLIDWATANEFWRTNILAMPKFRAKYDQLLLQARRDSQPRAAPGQRLSTTDRRIAEAELLKDNPDPAVLALLSPNGHRALPGGAP